MASTSPPIRWRTRPSKDNSENELFRLIRKGKWRSTLDFLAHMNLDGEETEEKKKNVEMLRHVDRNGMTALHWACFFCSVPAELIRILLKNFEEAASMCDNEGQVPLHIAVSTPVSSSKVRYLLDVYPLAVNLKDKEGHSPIELAYRRRESKRSFKALLEAAMMLDVKKVGGASVDGETSTDQTKIGVCTNASLEYPSGEMMIKEEKKQNEKAKDVGESEELERCTNSKESRTLLHWACSFYVPRELLREMIKLYGPNAITRCDGRGWTPLHVAARHSPTEIIDILIQACPAALSMPDDRGQTPLAIACEFNKRLETIEGLATRKDLTEVVDKNGNTPLHLVCIGSPGSQRGVNRSVEIVRYLLDIYPGATSIQSRDGATPLCLACSKNMSSKIVAMILETDRTQVNVATKNGETPLSCATRLKSIDTIKLLLKECPEASERRNGLGLTCLQEAFLADSSSTAMELLLDASTDQVAIAFGSDGGNMLHIACGKKSDDIIDKLASSCPQAASVRNMKGTTPLLLAVVKKRSARAIKALISADPTQVIVPDNDGNTSLNVLCKKKSICMDTLHLMISKCPEAVTVCDKEGRTPLWWLLKKGTINSLPATRLLIRYDTGHIALGDKEGTTPLHRATANGWGEVGHLVRACPEAVAVQNKNGQTPLHFACKCNVPFSVLDDLVDADVGQMSVPDNNGSTPSILFYQNNHGYICHYVTNRIQKSPIKTPQRALHCESSFVRDFYARLKLILGAEAPNCRNKTGASILNAALRSPACPSDYFDFVKAMVQPSWCYNEDVLGDLPIHAACAARIINYKDYYKCVKCGTSSEDSSLYLVNPRNENFHIPECRVHCGKCHTQKHNIVAYRLERDDKIQKIIELFPETLCIPNAHGRLPLFIALESGRLWDKALKNMICKESPHLYIQSRDSRTHLYPFMLAAVESNGAKIEYTEKSCTNRLEEEIEIEEEPHLKEKKSLLRRKLKQIETVFSLLLIDPTLVGCGV